MPKEMQIIDATRNAYDLMKEMREKHSHCTSLALEASVALRDVLVLMITDANASFDSGLTEITKPFEEQQRNTADFPT